MLGSLIFYDSRGILKKEFRLNRNETEKRFEKSKLNFATQKFNIKNS